MIELVRAGRKPGELAREFGCHVTSILNWVRQANAVSGVMPTQLGALSANERQELIEQRLTEFGGRKSLLNPLWYGGAFTMGLVAGALDDKWNLGCLAETERQVEAHLDGHLQQLPEADGRSRAVVEQMKTDEAQHAQTAVSHGAATLPMPVQRAMRFAADVMRQTAKRI